MDQLISIKRIPIKIEVNVTNSQLKPRQVTDSSDSSPAVTVQRNQGGGVQLSAKPYKVDMSQNCDTYVPAGDGNGLTLTYNAVASINPTQNEAQLINGAVNTAAANAPTIAAKSASRSIESILSQLPKTKNNAVSYDNGTLSINYSLDSGSGPDLKELSSGFEFVPGSIEFEVSQMPGLEIEYLGEPIYFPRSADPNYEGAMNKIV